MINVLFNLFILALLISKVALPPTDPKVLLMQTILRIDSSARHEDSHSRTLGDYFEKQ